MCNDRVSSTVSSCMACLGQIKGRVKHAFNRYTLISVINALAFSKLFYCSKVRSNTTESNLNKIQAVQNFAIRIISNTKKYDHVTPTLRLVLATSETTVMLSSCNNGLSVHDRVCTGLRRYPLNKLCPKSWHH